MLGKAFKFQLKKENQDLKGGKGEKDSKKGKDAKKQKEEKQKDKGKSKDQQKQQQQSAPPSQPVPLPPTPAADNDAPPAIPPHRNVLQEVGDGGGGSGGGSGGVAARDIALTADLTKKIDTLESEVKRKDERLAQLTAERDGLSKELTSLRADSEKLRSTNEKIVTEKWELSAANNELKNRLQQSMALSYMQDGTDTMLQEELHKMQVALAEERKVTEKLSRNLELEKRRVESMEQKLKNSFRRSGDKSGAAAAAAAVQNLPDEIRGRDDQLSSSMEKYRLHCENLSASLEECEGKLASFEIQEDYHVADLRKELSAVKKMLLEERKRSEFDSDKFQEVQTMFGTVFKDYANTIDGLKQLQQKKKLETQQQRAFEEIRENSYHEMTDNLTAKVLQAEEQLREERVKSKMLEDKLKKLELDAEAIPILKAQVEVYQTDFNQERAAREKIAGEKADLEEEVRKLKTKQPGGGGGAHNFNNYQGADGGGAEAIPPPIGLATVRDRVNHMDDATNRRDNNAFDEY